MESSSKLNSLCLTDSPVQGKIAIDDDGIFIVGEILNKVRIIILTRSSNIFLLINAPHGVPEEIDLRQPCQ